MVRESFFGLISVEKRSVARSEVAKMALVTVMIARGITSSESAVSAPYAWG